MGPPCAPASDDCGAGPSVAVCLGLLSGAVAAAPTAVARLSGNAPKDEAAAAPPVRGRAGPLPTPIGPPGPAARHAGAGAAAITGAEALHVPCEEPPSSLCGPLPEKIPPHLWDGHWLSMGKRQGGELRGPAFAPPLGPPRGLKAPEAVAPLLLTMPAHTSKQGAVWIPLELDAEEQEVRGRLDHLEPRQVLQAYCGLAAPRRRLPKGVPVKKAVPAWGF